MKINKLLTFASVLMAFAVSAKAQTTPDSRHFYEITDVKVPYEKLEQFFNDYEKYVTPIVKKNQYVLSEKVFTHVAGPDWTVEIIDEYKNWADMGEAYKTFDELMAADYPDKSKRDEIESIFDVYFNGHADAIVVEVPRLTK